LSHVPGILCLYQHSSFRILCWGFLSINSISNT
jgi:hypothetical protein